MKIARWFGALGFVALASLGCFAQAAEFTPEQKGAIEGIIREYLLKNPDVLQEALGELERRQQETQRGAQRDAVESEKQALFNSPNDAVVGNQKGNATLVVFFDYNCPYCKKAATDLDELMKSDPNLRVVLKEFPVVRPPDSLEAARIALAARQQLKDDKYFDFHMRLMTAKGLVNKERALEVAKEMKLDMAKLAKDTEAEEFARPSRAPYVSATSSASPARRVSWSATWSFPGRLEMSRYGRPLWPCGRAAKPPVERPAGGRGPAAARSRGPEISNLIVGNFNRLERGCDCVLSRRALRAAGWVRFCPGKAALDSS